MPLAPAQPRQQKVLRALGGWAQAPGYHHEAQASASKLWEVGPGGLGSLTPPFQTPTLTGQGW